MIEKSDVIPVQMKLSFSDVAAVLSVREVAVGLDLFGVQHPISDDITPHCDPYEHIATSAFDLLEVHIELFNRVRCQCLDV